MLINLSDKLSLKSESSEFLTISNSTAKYTLKAPTFELDGELVSDFEVCGYKCGSNAILFRSKASPNIKLTVELSNKTTDSVLRFRYRLASSTTARMTKKQGNQYPIYYSLTPSAKSQFTEIQLAQFLPQYHSFVPMVQKISPSKIANGRLLPGPIVEIETADSAVLFGYEHGAEYPNHYLHFMLDSDSLTLRASKSNYYDGQIISESKEWVSCWLEIGISNEIDSLNASYRDFIFSLSPSPESRKPYIFYNSWNYQERDRNYEYKPYLARMNEEKILAEIDVAHEMGIEVFVIDTGWYRKTGDWLVNTDRFTENLKVVRERLNAYDMKLGLWFNPTVAARTSEIVVSHPEYRMEWNGEMGCYPVWETEESYGMCICSDYRDYFVEKLVQLYNELDVRYFKWDGIGQSGCNSDKHEHGNAENSAQERAECYSYQMGLAMIDIVEKLSAKCPDAIVDFDVTEAGRFVGLGFLGVGKYFLVNNGPYAKDYDIPKNFKYRQEKETIIEPYTNLFFFPGSARPRVCRTGVRYDSIIPSQLFLTHYLPDGDKLALENSLASLVLGGNGIWGDLESLTAEERSFWKENLEWYKKVRADAVKISSTNSGCTGSSPEIYEKVDPETGRGIISFFTCRSAEYVYDTLPLDNPPSEVFGADSWEIMPNGSVRIRVSLGYNGARTVFLA